MRLRLTALVLFVATSFPLAAQDNRPIRIRAALVVDGTGRVLRDATVVVLGGTISAIETPGTVPATYDLGRLTLLPGLIDTHVHIGWHFGRDGRADNRGETPVEETLYGVDNAYLTLMAGFTTVQSVGAPSDVALRDGLARGIIPGPRLLTSIRQLNEDSGPPEKLREMVRQLKSDRADLVKIFASKSIREGGGQTMTDAQLAAVCGEAKAQGLRTMVHAHSAQAITAAVASGCGQIEHGSFADETALKMMAERGVYFDPNVGVVIQNYLRNKPKFLGIGNYTEEGFAYMEKALGLNAAMIKRAVATPGLKIVMGTDAVAGAHGHNADELVERVRQGGQKPMDAIVSATSLAARAIGLADRVGALAPGMDADVIAVDGDPTTDITALTRVVFVMRGGRVFKHVASDTLK